MNRALVLGVAIFFALVGFGMIGGEKQAMARGKGCCGVSKCEGRAKYSGRNRCEGRRRCSGRKRCCGSADAAQKGDAAQQPDAAPPSDVPVAPPEAAAGFRRAPLFFRIGFRR